MNRESPLLYRARKEISGTKFRIPRRGRIRGVLFLLVIAIAVWLGKSNSQQSAESSDPSLIAKVKNTVSAISVSEKKEHNTKSDSKPSLKYSFDDVEDILKSSSVRLSASTDTVVYKRDNVIIHSSIDSDLVTVINFYLKQYHPKYGAAVVLEPGTGRVLSLVSYTREGEAAIGDNLFCSNVFPAASIFKIVTSAGAIEKLGIGAQSIIRIRGANHTLYQSQLQKDLSACSREVTLEESFAYSINPAFARMGLFYIGSRGLEQFAGRFGFNEPIRFELPCDNSIFVNSDSAFTVAELASGFNQKTCMSPVFAALMASAVSNHGRIFLPTLVDSITDLTSHEKVYQRERQLWKKAVEPRTAEELVTLMRKVAEYGTARKAFRYLKQSYQFDVIDYGGKTGSVDKDQLGRVDWFVGFCRHRTNHRLHIAMGIVTVHDDNWTIHSSFIGAEIMRRYIQRLRVSENAVALTEEKFKRAPRPY